MTKISRTFEDHIKDSLTYKICKEKCKFFAVMVAIKDEPDAPELFDQIYRENCEECIVRELENDGTVKEAKVVS